MDDASNDLAIQVGRLRHISATLGRCFLTNIAVGRRISQSRILPAQHRVVRRASRATNLSEAAARWGRLVQFTDKLQHPPAKERGLRFVERVVLPTHVKLAVMEHQRGKLPAQGSNVGGAVVIALDEQAVHERCATAKPQVPKARANHVVVRHEFVDKLGANEADLLRVARPLAC